MSRFRLYPTPEQEAGLLRHCADARFVWNLAVEQQSWWRHGRARAPDMAERSRQLTEARGFSDWLREGCRNVQEQALRDFARALDSHLRRRAGQPRFRSKRRGEGFAFHDHFDKTPATRAVNARWSEVRVPKVGWVRYRRTRREGVFRSYRITRDAAGRWHVAFAAIPVEVAGPGTGEVVGIDRGVAVTLALSDGTVYHAPKPRDLTRLARRVSRRQRGSNRRERARQRLATARVRDADRLRDFVEKATTDIARRYDVIRVEDLRVKQMTKRGRGKRGLNRAILGQGWGQIVTRLEQKAPGRVERVPAAYTSQRCAECGHTARENRENQADFRCVACGHEANADTNAARNIAAGYAVTARGGMGDQARPTNREPQVA